MELFSVKTDSLAFSVECFSPHFQITTRDQISYRQKFNFLHCLKGFLLQSCQYMDIHPFQETTISSLLNRLHDIFVAIKIFSRVHNCDQHYCFCFLRYSHFLQVHGYVFLSQILYVDLLLLLQKLYINPNHFKHFNIKNDIFCKDLEKSPE